MKNKRIIIYPQDVQRITGRSERYGQQLLQAIKRRLGKEKHQLVTGREFSRFAGLEPEDIEEYF